MPQALQKGLGLNSTGLGFAPSSPTSPPLSQKAICSPSEQFILPPSKNMQELFFYQEVILGEHVDTLPAQVTQAGV